MNDAQDRMTYAVVSHNASGTCYRATYGFESVEKAHEWASRYRHCGVGDVVVAESDLEQYQRINDRWAPAARKLQQWPGILS